MTTRPFDPYATLNRAHEYARQHIGDPPDSWLPFVAMSERHHQVFGLWRLIEPGLQILLLCITPSYEQPGFIRVVRPTGVRVLDGSFIGTRKVGGTTFLTESRPITVGEDVAFMDPGCQYTMHAHIESCCALVVRGMPFTPRQEEREVPAVITPLEVVQAQALHRKMRRVLTR